MLFPTKCFGALQNLMVVKTQPGLVSQYNKSASSEEAGKLGVLKAFTAWTDETLVESAHQGDQERRSYLECQWEDWVCRSDLFCQEWFLIISPWSLSRATKSGKFIDFM